MALRHRYDTDRISEVDRFAFWREAVCESYVQLGCETDRRRDFRGLIEIDRHSALSVSRVTGTAHAVERRRRDIREASESYFLLSLQTAQSSTLTQFGKTTRLTPGDMALYSSADPYSLSLDADFGQIVVQLPSAKLLNRLPNADMLTANKFSGQSGIGKLVRENILAFSNHMDTSNQTVRSLLQETLIDLIATGLAAGSSEKLELSSPEQQVLLRTRSFVRGQLSDPDLDRNRVASEISMSVRRLNDILSKEGESISSFIRRIRLESAAEELKEERLSRLSISEIAFRNGFSNTQHFSTLFRSHFGRSPRDFRRSN